MKAGLEATIKCARHCENRRFQARFAHFLRAFCAFLACIFDARIRDQGSEIRDQVAAEDESFRLPQGRFSASSGQALERAARDWKGSPISIQKKKENAGLRAYKRRVERELAKSRLAGSHKTVKDGLEATIKCANSAK